MFVVEDEAHAEPQGEFETFEDAMAELRRTSGDAVGSRTECRAMHFMEDVRTAL